ncbi:MAG: hypothetical protein KFH87_12890 [Bacteroidetes bacterium]|nr:hypothetical protein [Bacteroidota bacterium]
MHRAIITVIILLVGMNTMSAQFRRQPPAIPPDQSSSRDVSFSSDEAFSSGVELSSDVELSPDGTAPQRPDSERYRVATFSSSWEIPSSDSTFTEEVTAGARLLYLTGASLGLALFDYVGYNLVRGNPTTTPIYRVIQGLVQAGVTWLLYEQVGLPTAIGFNLIWWTWGLDAIFYGYTELFNVGGTWKGRGVWRGDIMNNNCTWASWTPVGIARGMDPEKPIAGNTLVAQSLIGAVTALTITLTF